ncbi:hypothetical protein N0V88_006902 [Collariella sp. IMI 366227]|nr:hypothetical protein N0V88_006902 [Collariella sp. IMI 366227]
MATLENHYVDGSIFSKTLDPVMMGKLTDDFPPSTTPQTFSGPWDLWFYLHAKQKTNKFHPDTNPPTDHIPLAECLFRYDRGAFWAGTAAFAYFPFIPFTRLTRWFLNDFTHTRMLYRAFHGSNMSSGQITQDPSLPYSTAGAFIDYTASFLGIWLLWLCPLKGIKQSTFYPSYTNGDGTPQAMMNIGLRGKGAEDGEVLVAQNRELEKSLAELKGRKVPYSQTYYEEEEFWGLYNRLWYEGLRVEGWGEDAADFV